MTELFTLRVPFPEISNEVGLAKTIAASEMPKRPKDEFALSRGLDKPMWELVKECCRFQPLERPKADEITTLLDLAFAHLLATSSNPFLADSFHPLSYRPFLISTSSQQTCTSILTFDITVPNGRSKALDQKRAQTQVELGSGRLLST